MLAQIVLGRKSPLIRVNEELSKDIHPVRWSMLVLFELAGAGLNWLVLFFYERKTLLAD